MLPTCLAALVIARAETPADADVDIQVEADPRIELASIVFHLADVGGYSWKTDTPFQQRAEARFLRFRDHPAVQHARSLQQSRGISYDAVPSLVVHLEGLRARFREMPEKLDERWTVSEARRFARDLRRFRRDTDFDRFWEDSAAEITAAEGAMRERVAEIGLADFLARAFGEAAGDLTIVPSLTVGPSNYGVSFVADDGSLAARPVVAVGWSDDGEPVVGERTDALIVHEALHPFLNPIVQEHRDDWAEGAQAAHAAHTQAMKDQAYGSADTVAAETAVRSWVTWFFHDQRGGERACEEVRDNAARRFHGVGELAVEAMAHPGDPGAAMPELGEVLARSAGIEPPPSLNDLFRSRTEDAGAEVMVVAPEEGPVRRYAERMAGWLKGRTGQEHRVVAPGDALPADADIVYGTPATIPGLGSLLEANGFAVTGEAVERGDQRFEGDTITLIAALDRVDAGPLAVFTGTSDEAVVEANRVFHGPTRYVVADRSNGKIDILANEDPSPPWPECTQSTP